MPKAINSKYKKFRWGRVVIMKFDKKFYYNSFRRRASLSINSIQSISEAKINVTCIKARIFVQFLSEEYWLTSFLNRKYLIAPMISKFTCMFK